ncbi:MAG: TRAP transporter small permease [Arcobacter sp.]|nr:MAG: TRAP transporter small permease [Arcobacter sp.]
MQARLRLYLEGKLKKICLWWLYFAGILLLIVVLTTVINIAAFGLDKVARIFDSNVSALSGYEDLVRLLTSCIALMFFPWAQAQRGHVAVDFFADKFSSKWQQILDILWLSCTLVFVIFLGILMFLGMIESFEDGAVSTTLGWFEWPFYAPGIISLVLWSVVLAFQIFLHKGGKIDG